MGSSQEISDMRRALLNNVTCSQFQTFLSLSGGLLENDLLFWLEVQRYKELCHSHSDDGVIQRKISIIISCFICSSTPPSLRIHVPPDVAQSILSQRRTNGPYIFRQAQMCVFNELMKHWSDFVEFCRADGQMEVLHGQEESRWRERRKVGEEEKEGRSQEEEERFAATEEEESCGNEGMKERLHQVSWSYSQYMTTQEHGKNTHTQNNVTPSETGQSKSMVSLQ